MRLDYTMKKTKEVLIVEIDGVSKEDLELLQNSLEINHYSFYKDRIKIK